MAQTQASSLQLLQCILTEFFGDVHCERLIVDRNHISWSHRHRGDGEVHV
jgi:hypothetical protein